MAVPAGSRAVRGSRAACRPTASVCSCRRGAAAGSWCSRSESPRRGRAVHVRSSIVGPPCYDGRMEALAVLRDVFGHAAFRIGQREAVDAVLAGRDAVVLPVSYTHLTLPTN